MQVITGSISSYVFSIIEGKPVFLALLRAPGLVGAGTWQAVHGMIDTGETAYAAAWRETLEEAGVTPQRFFKTEYVESFYSELTDGVHLVPAFAAFVADAPPAVLSAEHTAYEWCSLDEVLRRFVWPSQRDAVRVVAAACESWPDTGQGLIDVTALVVASG